MTLAYFSSQSYYPRKSIDTFFDELCLIIERKNKEEAILAQILMCFPKRVVETLEWRTCFRYALVIFMDTQDIPALNVIQRLLLEVISRLESDELQFTWKLSRNKEGFSLVVNQVHVPAKRDPRDQAKPSSNVDVESTPRKSRKKSPSALAHDRARRNGTGRRKQL